MDSYSLLLERIRVPQPSMQRLAVISIFEKLRSAPLYQNPDSDSGRTAISHCLNSNSPSVVDQSVRELCRLVKEGILEVSRGLLELQAALEGCPSRFVDVFVKGIGFICRFAFRKDPSWRFDSPEFHPFVKVLSCRTEAQSELVNQVLLFIVQNKLIGFDGILKFLRPFLMFSILRIPFSNSSSSFVRHLISSMASLSCSFPSEAMLIIKFLTGCLKYFPRKNVEEFKYLIYAAEFLVDSFVVVLKQAVVIGMLTNELRMCGVELLETLLSLCTDICNPYGGSEVVIELSERLLLVQKELGLQYIPEFGSVITSLAVILTLSEFEHEQLSLLELSVFLLKWKYENEYIAGRAAACVTEELLFIFPVTNLLSSPSTSVKASATDLLSRLERFLADFLVSPKKLPIASVGFPSISKPESIMCRLLHHLWFQDQHSLSNSYFLKFACNVTFESKGVYGEPRSLIYQLREYSLMIAKRKKSKPMSQSQENMFTGIPLLLSSVVAILVMHYQLGTAAVDSLAAIGAMDPKVGIPLLLTILFYSKIFCNNGSDSHDILLKLLGILPSLASHYVMGPLILQTIFPMLHKDAKPVLYATAVRLLCKTWEVTDRVFGSLQGILQPKAFSDFINERNICISMAASVRNVCKVNPDRGVDLILSVSACIKSRDPAVQALGLESLGHLCEADVVDFYTAWDVIANHVLDYSVYPIVAHGLCFLLRWGAMDAEAYSEASKNVMNILWTIGTSKTGCGTMWIKARTLAFESLAHYEVDHIRKSLPDFNKRNMESLISEDNLDVLGGMERLEVNIINFEHITRRRLLKEKRVIVNRVEKLLDIFPQVMFSSGKSTDARELPGAALLCLALNPKDIRGQGTSRELLKFHNLYENALMEIAESLQLSRNILLALLSLQSWKPFMHRWMRAVTVSLDANVPTIVLNKSSKAADDILKNMCKIAEESIPRSAENIALAIGALCKILPPSAHAVASTASKFLLKWLYQYEHEHRQWSSALSLGVISSCLHATDSMLKLQIIDGLLEVAINSKSVLVKGACGVGLGFSCQDLTRVEVGDPSNLEEKTSGLQEATLLGKIVRVLSLMISQLCPSSFDSLQSLCENFPLGKDGFHIARTIDLSCNNCDNLEEDIWGVAGLVLGLGNSVIAIYRAGAHDTVLMIKNIITSWIPYVNSFAQNPGIFHEKSEIALSVGACLALPTVVGFCQRMELMDDDLDNLVNGYKALISELLTIKKSGMFHQSLLMASCIGVGNLLSCILDEGVHSMKVNDVTSLFELMRSSYTHPHPPTVHLGGMLGVVNAMGAGAGILTQIHSRPSSLHIHHEQKESSYIRGPILSSPVCEQLCTSLMQEMFLVAQDLKDRQIQRYAAWAVSFLRHRWWSKEFQTVNVSKTNTIDSKPVSQIFAEDSTVWQLCLWLMDFNFAKTGTLTHVNTVATVLRCLSKAPRLPDMDWGAIIRRCMNYESPVSAKLMPNPLFQKGTLREECINFCLAHANQVSPLLIFLDELFDLPRFRTLELKLQSSLLCHLPDIIKIFSGSRLEKLYDDMFDYFCSSDSSYHSSNMEQKSILRISFWNGLYQCVTEISSENLDYLPNMEKCMELLFRLLPVFPSDGGLGEEAIEKEWLEAVRCLGRAPQDWLMTIVQAPVMDLVHGGNRFVEVVKRTKAQSRLVMIGCVPVTELGKLKAYLLNTGSDGMWSVLIEVVAAVQHAEDGIKRQWVLDAVEISCITKYPSTALQFLGLLSSSFSSYMPLLILDRDAVLSDLPVTFPSLFLDHSWKAIAETVVQNLLVSTERIYAWAVQLSGGNDFGGVEPIDPSENSRSVWLTQVMHSTCIALKDHLPFEKQLRLANMVLP
ncbi:ARM repeat superfamily protein isoform X2 [Tasmannia lanceolata]|uniref:ARM repeat superfamily protein isoform X2 n=1 Tax=Tasmannia lanceolata TaxID=3420 RepID=UPI00406442D4